MTGRTFQPGVIVSGPLLPEPIEVLAVAPVGASLKVLFDGWALVREWSRIGQRGTVREAWLETEIAALTTGAAVRQRKERREYRAVGGTDQIW